MIINLLIISGCGSSTDSDEDTFNSTLFFSGYTWQVKTGDEKMGPGPNYILIMQKTHGLIHRDICIWRSLTETVNGNVRKLFAPKVSDTEHTLSMLTLRLMQSIKIRSWVCLHGMMIFRLFIGRSISKFRGGEKTGRIRIPSS